MRSITAGNHSDLTEMNRSAVVKILQQQEICSRASIARQTGLTQAAITKITAALMELGIVSEAGSLKGDGNRRSIGLRLNADRHQVIGVKFARGSFAVGVFDISGKMYSQFETEYSLDDEPGIVLAAMKSRIHHALGEHGRIVAIGMAVPGPFLRDEGRTALVTRRSAWDAVNFQEEFTEAFDTPVFIEHDANAGAMAEWWFGHTGRRVHTLAYLLAGEGVGAGVIEDGRLLLGARGAAGELGHISVNVDGPRCECGNYGCLELYCSASALLGKIREGGSDGIQPQPETCGAVFQAARAGNPKALAAVREAARYLGYGCVTLINAYNPDIITIGDSMAGGGDLMLPLIREVVKQRTLPELHRRVHIQMTGLGLDPTLYGAAAIATDKVLSLPSAFSGEKKKEPK